MKSVQPLMGPGKILANAVRMEGLKQHRMVPSRCRDRVTASAEMGGAQPKEG